MTPTDARDLVREFEWTRPRHHGFLTNAAPIFGTTPVALEQRLRRAARLGYETTWADA